MANCFTSSVLASELSRCFPQFEKHGASWQPLQDSSTCNYSFIAKGGRAMFWVYDIKDDYLYCRLIPWTNESELPAWSEHDHLTTVLETAGKISPRKLNSLFENVGAKKGPAKFLRIYQFLLKTCSLVDLDQVLALTPNTQEL